MAAANSLKISGMRSSMQICKGFYQTAKKSLNVL